MSILSDVLPVGHGVILDLMGESVVYQRAGQPDRTVQAIVSWTESQEIGLPGRWPAFTLKTADLGFTPAKNDVLVHGGKTYRIFDVTPDQFGFPRLLANAES